MRLRAGAIALLAVAAASVAPDKAAAQANADPAARCAQLAALYDRTTRRNGEGLGGPSMTRLGAQLDCENGL